MIDIQRQLDYLAGESRRFEKAVGLQADVWAGARPEQQPLLLMCTNAADLDADWPNYNYLEIHNCVTKMFTNGLREAVLCARGNAQAVPSIRANMGCGIIPTMFGLKQLLFEDKMPWVKEHLSKQRILDMGPDDLAFSDEKKMAFEHMRFIADQLQGTGCRLFPLDLQGAFDTAHLVYGDAIFTDLYDDPDFVHHLLDLSCHAIVKGMEACLTLIPDSANNVAHYNNLVMPRSRGGVKLSEDTSTLLSKAQIEEFVSPYMKRLLQHFHGGYIHYCGMNPHLLRAVMAEELAYGLNFGNPEKHDMDAVLRTCAEKGKVFYGGIPVKGNETQESYFRRCLAMSCHNGKSWLLPLYSCKDGEQAAVSDLWMEAAQQVRLEQGA